MSQNGNVISGSCLLEQEVSISDVGSQGFILDSGVALRAYPGLICSPRPLPCSLSGLRGLTLSLEKFFQVSGKPGCHSLEPTLESQVHNDWFTAL